MTPRRCLDCGATLAHRGHRAIRCRPCNYEGELARRLRFYHAHKTCPLTIAKCVCGRQFVKRRGNHVFCRECSVFYRRARQADASRRYYAKHLRRAA